MWSPAPVLLRLGCLAALLIFCALALPACKKPATASTTLYILQRDVAAGEKLALSDLVEVGLKEPAAGPDFRAAVVHSGNIKEFLGKPFARAVRKDALLSPDMFDPGYIAAATDMAPPTSLSISPNSQHLAAHGITVPEFSKGLQQLMLSGKPLTPDATITINGKPYRLGDLAEFGGP